ncbi:MAG: hypothetical protein ABI477_18095 [Chryseolinea sp.]
MLVCMLGGLICGETFLRIGDRFLSAILPLPVIVGLSVLILAASVTYAVIWHLKIKDNSDLISKYWIGAIRYGIAFDLAMFGFQKIFHLQFTSPLAMLDEPFSSLSSQWLTWSYFNRSFGFAVVIGASQIIGSLLLVYNRTRLVGVIVLMPILVNIIFIDYFYELDLGVQIHALILFAGLIYLLLLDYDRLIGFFLKHETRDTSIGIKNNVLKNTARLSIIFMPLVFIAVNEPPNKHPKLRGKYDVTSIRINKQSKFTTSSADSVLTRVYFDIANECVFQYNSLERRVFGTYELDEQNGGVTVSWHFPEKMRLIPFKGKLLQKNQAIVLTGLMGADSIYVEMSK